MDVKMAVVESFITYPAFLIVIKKALAERQAFFPLAAIG